MKHILVLEYDNTLYGISSELVMEIITIGQITTPFYLHKNCAGFVNHRGCVVPLMFLKSPEHHLNIFESAKLSKAVVVIYNNEKLAIYADKIHDLVVNDHSEKSKQEILIIDQVSLDKYMSAKVLEH